MWDLDSWLLQLGHETTHAFSPSWDHSGTSGYTGGCVFQLCWEVSPACFNSCFNSSTLNHGISHLHLWVKPSYTLLHSHPSYEPNSLITNNTSLCPKKSTRHSDGLINKPPTWYMVHVCYDILYQIISSYCMVWRCLEVLFLIQFLHGSSKESTTSLMELIPEFFVLPATWFLGLQTGRMGAMYDGRS